jgi:AcrR family transcriptional regulator
MELTSSIPNPDHTRSHLMQAASQLFIEKGYAATIIRAIAELAEVNEVTLFRHFGTKEKLAQAIIDQFGGLAIAGDFGMRFSGNYVQDFSLSGMQW